MLILLCKGLETLGNGLDLSTISESLREERRDVEIRIEQGLCTKIRTSPERAVNGKRLVVLGLCSRDFSEIEFHGSARKAGLDPFGIEVVNLGAYCAHIYPRHLATEKAKLLLAGAVARACAYQGSSSANLKLLPLWNQKVSRRSLFTLPPIRYEAVPSIREEACSADEGCRVCATLCPHEALNLSDDGRMILNKEACTSCGACVSACLRAAMDFPGASPEQIHAQIAALLGAGPPSAEPRSRRISLRDRGILFVCQRGLSVLEGLAKKGLGYPASWLPVEVPCIGVVTPVWHLECLNLGAEAVGVLPCCEKDCRFGQSDVVQGRVQYSRELLNVLGGSPERVRLFDPTDEARLIESLAVLSADGAPQRRESSQAVSSFTPRQTAQAILDLAQSYGASLEQSLDHPHSPLGDVRLQDGCTVCGACVGACPTGSLGLQRDSGGLTLVFNPQVCIGCGECVPVCPERVLSVKRRTDLQRLSQGRTHLCRTTEARCEVCGEPVAPEQMLKKIIALLGNDPSIPAISRRCLSCRGNMFFGD